MISRYLNSLAISTTDRPTCTFKRVGSSQPGRIGLSQILSTCVGSSSTERPTCALRRVGSSLLLFALVVLEYKLS